MKEQKGSQKDAYMKFYDASRPLYLEMDESGVSIGTRLLQVRGGMNGGCDEVPDNAPNCFHQQKCIRN